MGAAADAEEEDRCVIGSKSEGEDAEEEEAAMSEADGCESDSCEMCRGASGLGCTSDDMWWL